VPDAAKSFFCDANAGSPVDPEVLACFLEIERACPGNPASSHAPGRRARAVLEAARARIATALQVDVDDVLFTSGGTESANLAVRGLGDPDLPVLLGEVEHPAVMEPARERGVVLWQLDGSGAVVVADPGQDVGLVSLVHAQSELGTLQPVHEAAELSKQLRVPMFVDAAQTLGRVSLGGILSSADAVALSPHKCGGMRGHGVLIVRELTTTLRPLVRGGGQEHGLRPGTQSPALAAANALAIEQATNELAMRTANMAAMRQAFLRGLLATHVEHEVLTPLDASVPNTVMLRFPHVDGRILLPTLDLAGIHASHGSACSSGAPTPPRILVAMGLDETAARTCVRFSFGWRDDPETFEHAGRRVGEVVRARQKKN
jgi:cysteine desulfurase